MSGLVLGRRAARAAAWWGMAAVAAAMLGGCARVSSDTVVRPDGGFDRRVTIKSSVPDMGAEPGQGPKLDDWFVFPKDGEGWTVKRERVKDEDTATLTRTFAPGAAPFTDVRLVEKGKPQFENEVRVTKRPDGLIEVVETLKWKAEKRDEPDFADLGKTLEALLPENLRSPEAAKRLAERTARDFWRVIFGPGEPLLGQLLTHPDAAERTLKKRAADSLNLALESEFGGRMTDEQRTNFLRRAFGPGGIQSQDVVDPQKRAEEAGAGDSGNTPGLIAMLTAVRIPGSVVSTNGEVDLATGEVYWAYYPQAAAFGDVELRVVFRPNQP